MTLGVTAGVFMGAIAVIVRIGLRAKTEGRKGTRPPQTKARSSWRRVRDALLAVSLLGTLLTSVFSVVAQFQANVLNTTFNQYLAALGPHLSDPDVRTFRSRWALMKGRSDYDLIMSEFRSRAEKAGIQLPRR
jgi:hypothetical protein